MYAMYTIDTIAKSIKLFLLQIQGRTRPEIDSNVFNRPREVMTLS